MKKELLPYIEKELIAVFGDRPVYNVPNFDVSKFLDLQQKSGQLIARFKQLHFDYTFLVQIR